MNRRHPWRPCLSERLGALIKPSEVFLLVQTIYGTGSRH